MSKEQHQREFAKRELPGMIDNYEARNGYYSLLEHKSVEEYETVRELVAKWLASAWIEPADPYGSKFYRLTAKGYEQLKPKATAVTTMG